MAQIFPSLIGADLLNLSAKLEQLDPFVAGYHLDVMDFHFVPNLTWGPDFINAIAQHTKKPLMVHLMVDYPERYFDRFNLKEGDYLSVHPESRSDIDISQQLKLIRQQGWIPSLALNPETPVSTLDSLKEIVDHILLMAVNPGFSGQEFMPVVYKKIEEIRRLQEPHGKTYTIAIDGGVSLNNAEQLLSQGADQLAVGSAIFSSNDPIASLKELSDI